jgi:hypothetical protein
MHVDETRVYDLGCITPEAAEQMIGDLTAD